MKLPPKDLNLGPCPSQPTSNYTYRVTIAPRVCNGHFLLFLTCVSHVLLIINYLICYSYNLCFVYSFKVKNKKMKLKLFSRNNNYNIYNLFYILKFLKYEDTM